MADDALLLLLLLEALLLLMVNGGGGAIPIVVLWVTGLCPRCEPGLNALPGLLLLPEPPEMER